MQERHKLRQVRGADRDIGRDAGKDMGEIRAETQVDTRAELKGKYEVRDGEKWVAKKRILKLEHYSPRPTFLPRPSLSTTSLSPLHPASLLTLPVSLPASLPMSLLVSLPRLSPCLCLCLSCVGIHRERRIEHKGSRDRGENRSSRVEFNYP